MDARRDPPRTGAGGMTDDLPARLLCAKLAVQAACERADRAEQRIRELEAQLADSQRETAQWQAP